MAIDYAWKMSNASFKGLCLKKIAVFAHDAGGAEIVLELFRANLQIATFRIFCLESSPCFRLVRAKGLDEFCCKIEPLKEDIEAKLLAFNPNVLLYSTGWQNHLEYHFLDYANANKLPSVAFLDHWINYRERFGYPHPKWQENLPTYIATHDKPSYELALKLGFSNAIAIQNYALKKELEEANKVLKTEKTPINLLFLSEPTAKVAQKSHNDAYFWGFDEKVVFSDILQNFKHFECEKLIVRLHPSDTKESYQNIDKHAIFSDSSLVEDIANAKVIIGIDTTALYTAYLLGKHAISYIPSDKRECVVPLPKKNQLKTLENFSLDSIETLGKKPDFFGMDFALFLKSL